MFEEQPTADPKAVASVILGGGVGTRLFPLTSRRAKPAVRVTTHTYIYYISLFLLESWLLLHYVSFEFDNMSNSYQLQS